MEKSLTKIGVMFRGDWRAPTAPARHAARLQAILDALDEKGAEPVPVVYLEETADAVRQQLLGLDGVLVWINPIEDGRDRSGVDALLREVARAGVWVSTHPDVIDKMGCKDVLYLTRELGWSADTERYNSPQDFAQRFADRLGTGARVLKPRRGNAGHGVMKVEADRGSGRLKVQHAEDDRVEMLSLEALSDLLAQAFAATGAVIDQAFQPAELGMVRCYMSLDRVIGFGEQQPRTAASAFGMNSAKAMQGADHPPLRDLRERMEGEWTPGLQRLLAIDTGRLPALWDADFLFRPRADWQSRGRFVLCEVNVSCVSPFPPAAPRAVAQVARELARRSA